MSSANIENSEISQQQSFPVLNSQQSTSQNNEHSPYKILEVWKSNLNEVFEEIRQVVKKYPFIAMDTEFPGVVARPIGNFASVSEFHYQSLKVNVDLLQIIQLGLSFFDEHGNPPVATSTYQFNFNFNMATDMYASDSIYLLKASGIDFKRHGVDGIDPIKFAELLTTSGLVMMDSVVFLSFHSGYDFGYLMKLLTNAPLPTDEVGFFETLKMLFPNIYDVKYLMKSCKSLKGGLEDVAKQLEIPRYGPSHQAGSDSLLTGLVFFRIKDLYFENTIDEMKYSGHLFGLGICSMYAPTSTSSLYTQELHQSTMAAQAAAASGATTTTTPTDSSMLSFNVSPGTQSSGSTVSAITMNSSASTMLPSISDGNTSSQYCSITDIMNNSNSCLSQSSQSGINQ